MDWKQKAIYEGFLLDGFELNEFSSCHTLGWVVGEPYGKFQVGFYPADESNFWRTYEAFFREEYRPVYVKFRGKMTGKEIGGFGCCSAYSRSVEV